MNFKAFILSLILLIVFSKKCFKFECDTNIDACAITINDTVSLNKNFCEEDEYCDFYYDAYSHCNSLAENDRLPGRKCIRNSECYSYVCLNNVCQGSKLEKSCSSTASCDIGLYCNEYDGVCMSLKNKGDYCEYSNECDYQFMCLDNNCIEYFSIESGGVIPDDNCYRTVSYACSTGQCDYNDDGDTICIDGYEYDEDIISCDSDDDCLASSGGLTNYYECYCGMNALGHSYCQVTLGSSYGKAYIDFLKYYVTSDTIRKAHTYESFINSLKDWGSQETYISFVEKYFWAMYGHYAKNGLDCAKDMFFDIYYYNEISFGSIIKLGIVYLVIN